MLGLNRFVLLRYSACLVLVLVLGCDDGAESDSGGVGGLGGSGGVGGLGGSGGVGGARGDIGAPLCDLSGPTGTGGVSGSGGTGGVGEVGGSGGAGGDIGASLCSANSCGDSNDCTVDECDAADGSCSHEARQDGVSCMLGTLDGTCAAGLCTPMLVTAVVCEAGCDFATIQAAIDAAQPNDVVLVRAGIYDENINFLGKSIAVASEEGAGSTTIQGDGSDSVVTFASGETRSSLLQGFTITGGFASFDGGGIRIDDSSPTVAHNVVSDNIACSGAGIAIGFGSPLIYRNEILRNRLGGCSGGRGGGIAIRGAAVAEIVDNLIAGNTSSSGAGIDLFAAGDPTIRGNIIRGNTATGEGGGLSLVNRSDVLIVQNLIYDNLAPRGGGVFWSVPSRNRGPRLVHNTIVDNISPRGSALFASGFQDQTVLVSNLLVGRLHQSAVYCERSGGSEPQYSHTNAYSPGAPAYIGECCDPTGLDGNFSDDPRFVDADGRDYRLQTGSSSIDAADASLPDLPPFDFAGAPRSVNGDGRDGAEPDLGALEFQGR